MPNQTQLDAMVAEDRAEFWGNVLQLTLNFVGLLGWAVAFSLLWR